MINENNLTLVLQGISSGEKKSPNELISRVYSELKEIARRQLYGERANHTLNPTALANEAYLKLIDQQKASYKDRQHFFALAAGVMRRILIDYARARKAQKRGGEAVMLTFVEENISKQMPSEILLDLDELLQKLSGRSKRQASIVEYWFFAGMKHNEIAAILNVSVPTVRREWRLARAWLSRELKELKD